MLFTEAPCACNTGMLMPRGVGCPCENVPSLRLRPSAAVNPLFHPPPQAALPLTSQVGATLPQRQAQAQSPRRFQLPQLRPPPQYTQLPQQAAFWPMPPQQQQQQPQQQQPPQQQATQPRLPQQQQWQMPALPASQQQQQQQAGFGGAAPQDGAGSVSQNGGGSARQTQAYVHPADTDGRSYLGPVLPPIAKKKRT